MICPETLKMSDRKSVRAELERKRIQLAQMREERERRSRLLQGEDENIRPSDSPNTTASRTGEADSIIQSLGLSATLSRALTVPSNVSSLDQSQRAQNVNSPDVSQIFSHGQQSLTDSQSYHPSNSTPRSVVPLEVVHVNQINIPPKERVYYSKSTQTTAPTTPPALEWDDEFPGKYSDMHRQ